MPELKRKLGLFEATMYGVGLILGAGIYVLIGKAAGYAGNTVWLSFLLAALISAFTGLSYAELSSMYPKEAAEYVYIKNAFASNFLAFLVGCLVAFSAVVAASTVALGFAGYLTSFYNSPLPVSAAVLIFVLSLLNFLGIRESSELNILFTLVEAGGLVFIIVLGFAFSRNTSVDYFASPTGISGVLAALALIFFAFSGFESIANVAEETKSPRRILPKAFVLSIAITTILYTLVSLATIRVISWQQLEGSAAPLADVAERIFGPAGRFSLAFVALFATTNTVLIALVNGSRVLYGMAAERSLPPTFARIHAKTRTPWVSVFIMMMAGILFVFLGDLVTIANITVFTIVVTWALVNFSTIWLRYKHPSAPRPFRVPVSIGKIPLPSVLGLVAALFGATQLNVYAVGIGLGVLGGAALVYVIYAEL